MAESKDFNEKIGDFTKSQYRSFMDYVEFRDEDPVWMLGYKLLLRFLGIVLMILLSPVLIVGLFIAFIAVF
ncbi:MAG: hypothetical protein KDC44_12945 [Phaeodactylibacter sp.]|nr:hypothetical protein [Phaeodactylibacter sp.]